MTGIALLVCVVLSFSGRIPEMGFESIPIRQQADIYLVTKSR